VTDGETAIGALARTGTELVECRDRHGELVRFYEDVRTRYAR